MVTGFLSIAIGGSEFGEEMKDEIIFKNKKHLSKMDWNVLSFSKTGVSSIKTGYSNAMPYLDTHIWESHDVERWYPLR